MVQPLLTLLMLGEGVVSDKIMKLLTLSAESWGLAESKKTLGTFTHTIRGLVQSEGSRVDVI